MVKIISSNSTLGNDEGAFAIRMFSKATRGKANAASAIFNHKHIKFKKPILQWEQNIGRVK